MCSPANAYIVLGVEADLNFISLKKNYLNKSGDNGTITLSTDDYFNYEQTLKATSKIEWFGTIRPRLGFVPTERLMIYATGGLAYGRVKSSASYEFVLNESLDGEEQHQTSSFSASSKNTRWGWTIGAGAEYALTEKISVKGEFLHVDLGKKSTTIYNPDNNLEFISFKDKAKFNTVRVGFNYRF